MNIILFDDPVIRKQLLPFTFTRPIADIRIGIFTIEEKWKNLLSSDASYFTEEYLQIKFPLKITNQNVCINSAVCPDIILEEQIKKLQEGQMLVKGDDWIAFFTNKTSKSEILNEFISRNYRIIEIEGSLTIIRNPWDIYTFNGIEIIKDFESIIANKKSHNLQDKHTITYNLENIFIEEGVHIRAAILNAEEGPIYIGKNVQIQEGAIIKGPFAVCEGSTINMGAKMRGNTTIGPFSRVGGEVSNSVIFGCSNKGHEGFLGNSVLGEWCNLGADTNTSNLKNNYSTVKVWSYHENNYISTGKQFCGLLMGDHSKSGINTMFNTGTMVGVSANVFGGDYPPKFIPSFDWGGKGNKNTFEFEKAIEVAAKVMERRNIILSQMDISILKEVYQAQS